MHEIVGIVNGVMRIKDADIMHRKGIGPKGTSESHWVVLKTRGPHDFGPPYWARLKEALATAGYSTRLNSNAKEDPPRGSIELSKGRRKYYITLEPANQEGDIEIHYAAESPKRTLTARQHLELSLDIARLLREKLHAD